MISIAPFSITAHRRFTWSLLATLLALSQAKTTGAAETDAPAASQQAYYEGVLLSPKAFRATVNRVLPSMAVIQTFGGTITINSPSGGSGKKKGQPSSLTRLGEGPTTGLALTADGLILTSAFAFENKPPVITVTLSDGSQHVAQILGRDFMRNLCVLKITDAPPLTVPEYLPNAQETVRVGQWAVAVGFGYGNGEPSISAGIISGLNRIGGYAIQTDANLSPSNYGGPLLDLDGRVIGICVPLSPNARGTAAGTEWYDSGIGFAVPIDLQSQLIQRLIHGQDIHPGWLGINLTLDPKGHIIIQRIVPDSPAKAAGLQKLDRILKINETKINSATDFLTVMKYRIAGESMSITYNRGSKTASVDVTLVRQPARPTAPAPTVTPTPPTSGAKEQPDPSP